MKRPQFTRRRLQFDQLEARKLLAAGNDFYELKSDGDLYADAFFQSTADPVIPAIDASGRHVFDFSVNRPGDQTTDITFAKDYRPATRVKIDPTKSYQFAFIGYEGEGAFVVESFNSSGSSLGKVAVPYAVPAREGLNYFHYTHAHAMIGPGGQPLPVETAWIDLVNPPQSPYTRFGFVEDYTFAVQSDRSVDQLKSPVTQGVDPNQSYTLSAHAINHSSATSDDQLHSLGYVGLDADRIVIEPIHTQKYRDSTDARLASPLNPGDTTIALTTTDGWSNTSFAPSSRALAWYGYRDSSGKLYPDFTYTRNVARDVTDGMWSRGGISGNLITLNKPWAGPALPTGTAMRNAIDGQPLVAVLLDHAPLASAMTATLHGEWTDGTPVADRFAPGTRYVQLAATINQSSVTVDERVSVRMQFDRDDSVMIVTPHGQSRVVTLDVLANDGSSATEILSVTNPQRGNVEIVAGGRQLVYRPQDYFIGTDSFTYDSIESSGARVSHQVQLKSLGGSVDSNPALQNAIESAQSTPVQYRPSDDLRYRLFGVKDQVLNSSLYSALNTQTHAHRLDEIGFQAGSLSLQANGDFDYLPIAHETYEFPFLNTVRDGSDGQPAISLIRITETEFNRDQSRLAAIGQSVQYLADAQRRLFFPAGLPLDSNGRPFLSWRVHILPYLGYQELYSRFKQDEPWNSPNNLPLLAEMPEVFRSASEGPGVTSTRFQALASPTYPSTTRLLLNNADGRGDLNRLNQVTDDLNNTLLIVQAGADKAIPWTKNVDLAFDGAAPLPTLGNVGPYFNAYFWGQQVRALPTDMDQATFQGLVTANQGDFADPNAISREAMTRSDFPGDFFVLNEQSQNERMRDLNLAMFSFDSTFRSFAPRTTTPNNNFSWRVWLLPYIGQQTLFDQFHFDEPWDSPHNLSVAARMPDAYRSLDDAASVNTTRFRVLGGPNMAYGHATALSQGPRVSSFTDGTRSSILIVEAGTDKRVPWTMPEVLPVNVADFWTSMGNLPGNEMLIGMADGSTLRAPRSTANQLMIGLATINQGDANRSAYQATQPEFLASSSFQTRSNLQQIGLAAHNFQSTFKILPINFVGYPSSLPTTTNVGLSWRVAILPFIEEGALYSQFHLDEPWDSPHNLGLLPLMPDIYKISNKAGDYTTRMQRFSGPGTLDPKQKIGFNQIPDGQFNTLFAGAVAQEKAVLWTKPDDIEFVAGDDWSVVGNIEYMPVVMADGGVSDLHNDQELGLSAHRDYANNLPFDMLVLRNDGGVNAPNTRTLVISEDGPVTINVTSSRPLLLEFADAGLAQAAGRADGYVTRYGPQQRITVEAIEDRDGKRRTQLLVKAPSSNPDLPPELLQTIDLIIVDSEKLPTLSSIADITIAEDTQDARVTLGGITAGRAQPAVLSARSLTPALVDSITIDYLTGSRTATLALAPGANQSGTAVVEVTVSNAGADGNMQSTADNEVTRRTFAVTIQAVNDSPTIDEMTEIVLPEDSAEQLTTITGIGAGPGEIQPVRVTATTNSLLLALGSTNLTMTGATATVRWTPMPDRFGQAVILVQVEDGGLDGDLATTVDNGITVSPLTVTLTPKNDPPIVDRPANQLVLEDAFELVIPLENFSAGPYETDEVSVTASVGNALLLEELTVQRLPGSAIGRLLVKTRADQYGSTMITLRVEDGGADNDLSTTFDNLISTTAFELVVQAVNDAPVMNVIENMVVDVASSDVSVNLSGISPGAAEIQPLRITASTDAPYLISKPAVEYIAGSNATLKFSTLGTSPGQGIIRVVVEDGGLDGNLSTPADNLAITRQFLVTANVPPLVGDDLYRIVKNQSATLNVLDNDVDVSDTLIVVISQAPLVDQGTVQVNGDGTLLFTPANGFSGVVNFNYRVTDQYGRSSGIAQVIVGVAQSKFQNPFNMLDVNSDGHVSPLDALLIINMLNDPNHPKQEDAYTGSNDLDTNGDGAFSAIDALLVINKLNQR